MTIAQQIRSDIATMEHINEGTLKNLGMAAAVAGGLMSHNPASAGEVTAALPSAAAPSAIRTTQSIDARIKQLLPWWENLSSDVRLEITNRMGGGPKAFIRQQKSSGNGRSDAQLMDDWLGQANGIAVLHGQPHSR
jgi:hypothetical protein